MESGPLTGGHGGGTGGAPLRGRMPGMHFSEACSGLLVELTVRLDPRGGGPLIFHASAFSWFDQTPMKTEQNGETPRQISPPVT